MNPTPQALRAAETICEYFREFGGEFEDDIAAIIDREMAGGWRPIEEWDGSHSVDIWAGNERFIDCYMGLDGKPRQIMRGMSIVVPFQPTHFRPLPTPPTA